AAAHQPAGSPAADDTAALEQTRQQLSVAWQHLAGMLDASWRDYLQLPAELLAAGRLPDASTVAPALNRYDVVAADARYAALTQRPEFVTVHGLLRQYSNLQARQATS